jgi:hypothetical protein
MRFRLFRSLSVATGLAFLLSALAPPRMIPSRAVLISVAGPFLVLGWMPRLMAGGLTDALLTAYAGVLMPVTLLMGLSIAVFSYEKSPAVIYFLQLVMVTSVFLTGFMMLRESPSGRRSGIATGVVLGLMYLPVVVGIFALRAQAVGRPEDVYRSAACVLRYYASHGSWVPALRQAAELPGCDGIEEGIEFKPSASGFSMRTTREPVYYTDDSGILRIDGPSGPIVKNCAQIVRIIVFGLEEYRRKEHEYPASLETVPSLRSYLQQQNLSVWCQISYERKSAAAFVINARPTTYGVTGLRSFYADQTGSIHATPFDRRATLNDPTIPEQEARGL